MNIVDTKYIVKSQVVADSNGNKHTFNMIRTIGGYTFTWDDKPVDWSFTTNGYYQAMSHFQTICDDVVEVDYMNNWVNG